MKLNKFRKGFIFFLVLVGVFYGFQYLFRSPMPWLAWVFLVIVLVFMPWTNIYNKIINNKNDKQK